MTTKRETTEEELRALLEAQNFPKILIQEILEAFPDSRQRNKFRLIVNQDNTIERAISALYIRRKILMLHQEYKGKTTYPTMKQLEEMIQQEQEK